MPVGSAGLVVEKEGGRDAERESCYNSAWEEEERGGEMCHVLPVTPFTSSASSGMEVLPAASCSQIKWSITSCALRLSFARTCSQRRFLDATRAAVPSGSVFFLLIFFFRFSFHSLRLFFVGSASFFWRTGMWFSLINNQILCLLTPSRCFINAQNVCL